MAAEERGVPVVRLFRTHRAVRAALTVGERFVVEMAASGVLEGFSRWRNIVAMRASSAVVAAVERYVAGPGIAVPIQDVSTNLGLSA